MKEVKYNYKNLFVEQDEIMYVCVQIEDTIIKIPLIDIILKIEHTRFKK